MAETPDAATVHRDAVLAWRAAREQRLRNPMGWLTLVGLHWLSTGEQRFGADEANEIVLRAAEGEVPAVAGTLAVVEHGSVLVHPAPGSPLTIGGQSVPQGHELADDAADEPTVLELASLRLVLIRRAGRPALRVRDTAAPVLRAFRGLDYFPIDDRFRVQARLVRATPGTTIPIASIVGDVVEEPVVGTLEFEIEGQPQRLVAMEQGDGRLALPFADATTGMETYGGGRYLESGPVEADDTVEVDFNLAYSPPCIFSPYATCEMPPAANRLTVRVEAGERVWTPPDA